LVAEDNSANQQLALLQLRELGFPARAFANGLEAVEAFKTGAYSLILMDCQMPEMDGFQATRAIRELEASSDRHIPIIAMTAQAMPNDRDACIESGMDDYIAKPITAQRLDQALARWIAGSGDSSNLLNHAAATSMLQQGKSEYATKMNEWENSFGNKAAVQLMSAYVENIKANLDSLTPSLEQKDTKTAKSLAHALKGMCLNCCSEETSKLCKQMESEIIAEDWINAEKLHDLLKLVLDSFLAQHHTVQLPVPEKLS